MLARAAWLIEGVHIDGPMRMPPLSLSQVSFERGCIGSEGREIFNAELADCGFVSRIDRPSWAAQIAPHRSLVRVISDDVQLAEVEQTLGLHALATRCADLLAVICGGMPEVIAGVVEVADDREWRALAVYAGGGAWQASLLRKLLPDNVSLAEDDPAELWRLANADARTTLSLSLFRGIARDRVAHRRIFRACSLLETIACEVAPARDEVIDRCGRSVVDRDGTAVTTATVRGKIQWVVQRSLIAFDLPDTVVAAHPSRTLWDEVGTWYDVRNSVAHEGYWPPPPQPTGRPERRDRVAEAFALAARGDGLESGWLRYADTCCAAVEVVMRAALQRTAFPIL